MFCNNNIWEGKKDRASATEKKKRLFVICSLQCCIDAHFFLVAAVIFPSLMQLPKGISDLDDRRQKAVCTERYRRRDEDDSKRPISEIDIEREEECGICMEMNSKVVLPTCSHAMCMKCYRQW